MDSLTAFKIVPMDNRGHSASRAYRRIGRIAWVDHTCTTVPHLHTSKAGSDENGMRWIGRACPSRPRGSTSGIACDTSGTVPCLWTPTVSMLPISRSRNFHLSVLAVYECTRDSRERRRRERDKAGLSRARRVSEGCSIRDPRLDARRGAAVARMGKGLGAPSAPTVRLENPLSIPHGVPS
jgi:hypothetical protein